MGRGRRNSVRSGDQGYAKSCAKGQQPDHVQTNHGKSFTTQPRVFNSLTCTSADQQSVGTSTLQDGRPLIAPNSEDVSALQILNRLDKALQSIQQEIGTLRQKFHARSQVSSQVSSEPDPREIGPQGLTGSSKQVVRFLMPSTNTTQASSAGASIATVRSGAQKTADRQLERLRAVTQTNLLCPPPKVWRTEDKPLPSHSPQKNVTATGATTVPTISKSVLSTEVDHIEKGAHDQSVSGDESGLSVVARANHADSIGAERILESNIRAQDINHWSPSKRTNAATMMASGMAQRKALHKPTSPSATAISSACTSKALTVAHHRPVQNIASAFESFSRYVGDHFDSSEDDTSDTSYDIQTKQRQGTNPELECSLPKIAANAAELEEREEHDSSSTSRKQEPSIDVGDELVSVSGHVFDEDEIKEASASSLGDSAGSVHLTRRMRRSPSCSPTSIEEQSLSRSSSKVPIRQDVRQDEVMASRDTQLDHSIVALDTRDLMTTDIEEGRVEEKIFQDIRNVWQEVSTLTRSTSLGRQSLDAQLPKHSGIFRETASYRSPGLYDLPDIPVSPAVIVCHQAAIDDDDDDDDGTSRIIGEAKKSEDDTAKTPSLTRKRKRVSDINSTQSSSKKSIHPVTASQNSNATPTVDASLRATSLDSQNRDVVLKTELDSSQVTPQSSTKKRRAPAGVSTALFPPISAIRFGLLQEKLWQEPFWLLIAVTFLNKTPGRTAAPTFWELKELYLYPAGLSNASLDELRDMIRHLGLQTQRAMRLLKMARTWVMEPPVKGRMYRTLHYPEHGEGKEYGPEEVVDEDMAHCAGALEIGHIPGCGPYAWDSWRIFCRDVLRGVAEDYNGLNAAPGFQPEWQRVLPLDKELRAYLRWMWLREGYVWNPETGKKRAVNDLEREQAIKGQLGPTDEDEIKFTAQAQEASPVKVATMQQTPTRHSARLSSARS